MGKVLRQTNNLHWDGKGEVIDPYGFIYITTNLISGKRYIGQKNFDKRNKWRKYLGSGSALLLAIDKYGKENFSRVIVDLAFSKEELDDKEYKWIKYLGATHRPDYYNIVEGGNRNVKFLWRTVYGSDDFQNPEIIPSIDIEDWRDMQLSDPNLSDQ